MLYQALNIPDVILISPNVHGDDRGFFMETYRQNEFVEQCADVIFVQDNHSRSAKGILRGLHYQLNQPQGKLVRVTRGEVFDVAVDMRRDSPNFGEWVGVILSENNNQMLWVPPGFAHGFYVTSEVAEFQYKCTDYYAPDDEVCVKWDDPDLAIEWSLAGSEPVLSTKDRQGLPFCKAPTFDAL